MSIKKFVAVAVAVFVLGLSVAAQNTPSDLRDLVGVRASSGQNELRNRGYDYVKTEEGGDRKYTYYWSNSRRQCISVMTYNGRYDAIVSTPPFDCGRNNNSGGGGFGDDRQGVTVYADKNFRGTSQSFGVGRFLYAGNQLGALRNDDASSVVVDRGFRVRLCEDEGSSGAGEGKCEEYGPGRYNLRYNDKASYIEVRRGNGGFGAGGDYGRPVNVSDLVGRRQSNGDSQMRSRGFRNVDTEYSGNTRYGIWWRNQSRQCIQVAYVNGRYDSVTDIGNHRRCQ